MEKEEIITHLKLKLVQDKLGQSSFNKIISFINTIQKENEDFNVITDNSKVNINLLKQIETLKAENELLRKQKNKWRDLAESYIN